MNDNFSLTIKVDSENSPNSEFKGFEKFCGTINDKNCNNKSIGQINLFISEPLDTESLSVFEMFNSVNDFEIFLPFVREIDVISDEVMEKMFLYYNYPFLPKTNDFKKVAVLDNMKLKKKYLGKHLASDKLLDMLTTLNIDEKDIPILVNCIPLQYKTKNRDIQMNKAFAKSREELKNYYEDLSFVEFFRDDNNLLMISMVNMVAFKLREKRDISQYV